MLKKKSTARSKFARPQKATTADVAILRHFRLLFDAPVKMRPPSCGQHEELLGHVANSSCDGHSECKEAADDRTTSKLLDLCEKLDTGRRKNTILTETRGQIKRVGSCSFSSNNGRIVGKSREE